MLLQLLYSEFERYLHRRKHWNR